MGGGEAGRPAVSIIIATRDRAGILASCLASVAVEEPSTTEVLVVDNASTDGTAELVRDRFPAVRLIRSEENLGFARAGNLAAAAARGASLLFLNDDTVWPGRILPELLAWQGRLPGAGMIGPRLRNPDGSIQTSVFRFPSPLGAFRSILPRAGGYAGFRYRRERDVDVVSGACFLIRADLFRGVGGFDERFFMYGEETDLARRLARTGRRCRFVPCGDIVHLGSANTRMEGRPSPEYLRGHLRYCATHMGRVAFRCYLAAKIIGHAVRAVAGAVAGRTGRARRDGAFVRAFAGAFAAGRDHFLLDNRSGATTR